MIPNALYIHIPFCIRKCDYCDFFSVTGATPDILERYTCALIAELRMKAARWNHAQFDTIFLGGGTPSLLLPDQVSRILEAVFANYKFVDGGPEISLEANPATLQFQQMQELGTAGINRLSIGGQSFLDTELRIMGRIHDAKELMKTLEMVAKTSIHNVNLDLIYGIPGQSIADWQYSLNQAVKFDIDHLSTYLLQLASNTPMAHKIEKGNMMLPEDDMQADMHEQILQTVAPYGYQQYELSNYSKPGYECQHNVLYWQSADYMGIGAGAVSLEGNVRSMNIASVRKYIEAGEQGEEIPNEVLEEMTNEGRIAEAVVMGLRLCKGIDRNEFLHRFGVDLFETYEEEIEYCVHNGLLNQDLNSICLTRAAYFVSNEVFYRFLR
ncbi:MAG: radical SAM family heme chaperone HemW [Bacillota bacterium]|nr:radical SAM family heme chaperone HemW [Bacillota bacterium]